MKMFFFSKKKGTHDILVEKLFVKEKLSQVVVEIAKREWPQHWLNLIDMLLELLKQGVLINF